MSFNYIDSLQGNAKRRYAEKLGLIGLQEYPYQSPADQWVDNPKLWPSLNYHDVYHHLINEPGIFTKEAMENYKALDAFQFFRSGWVQAIYHMRLPNKNIVLKTEVRPSWRVTEEPHHPWVALTSDAQVIAGHCDCMAGLGEACSHVGALLYKVEAAVRLGYTASACTDEPCKWNQNFTKKVEPARISKTSFYADSAKRKIKQKRKSKIPPPSTLQQEEEFVSSLAAASPSAVGLTTYEAYAATFISTSSTVAPRRLPAALRNLHSPDVSDLNQHCHNIKQSLKLTSTEIKYAEEVTRAQADSMSWHDMRAGRITSSVAHAMFRTNSKNPAISLLKKICMPSKRILNTLPIKYGRDHERDAFNLYSAAVSGRGATDSGKVFIRNDVTHRDCVVSKCGLFLCQDKPFLGASPDGIVNCSCCGKGVMEIKCPYSLKDCNLKESFGKKDSFIKEDMTLCNRSAYYCQVQHEMYVCGVQYCDFIVWTPQECLITRVPRDEAHITSMVEKFEKIWEDFILPELVTRQLEYGDQPEVSAPPKQDTVERYCICRRSEVDEEMVACDQCNEWFHLSCLKLKCAPRTSTWYCKACKAKKAKK